MKKNRLFFELNHMRGFSTSFPSMNELFSDGGQENQKKISEFQKNTVSLPR